MVCIKRLNLFNLNLCIDFNNNFHKSAHTIDVAAAAAAAAVNRDATNKRKWTYGYDIVPNSKLFKRIMFYRHRFGVTTIQSLH